MISSFGNFKNSFGNTFRDYAVNIGVGSVPAPSRAVQHLDHYPQLESSSETFKVKLVEAFAVV